MEDLESNQSPKLEEQNPKLLSTAPMETSINKSLSKLNKPKKNTGLMVAIMVAVLGVGFGTFGVIFGLEKSSEAELLNNDNVEKEQVIEGLRDQVANCENDGKPCGENDASIIRTMKRLDEGKCLNSEIGGPWLINDSGSALPILTTVDAAGEVQVSVDWDALKEECGYVDSIGAGSWWDARIKINTSGPVVDMLTGSFGNGCGYDTLLLLIEDGTVEYVPIRKAAIQEGTIRTYGKVPGVENVVKLYTATHMGLYSSRRLVAQRADGDYYDLTTILMETGDYEW